MIRQEKIIGPITADYIKMDASRTEYLTVSGGTLCQTGANCTIFIPFAVRIKGLGTIFLFCIIYVKLTDNFGHEILVSNGLA